PSTPPLFPYTTLFRSYASFGSFAENTGSPSTSANPPTFSVAAALERHRVPPDLVDNSSTDSSAETVASSRGTASRTRPPLGFTLDRKSTRLNSSHVSI